MATRKGKVKSAEFSCGSSGVGKSDACRKPWSFGVVLSDGETHKKQKNAGVVQGSSTGKVIGLGAWCGGQKPLGLLGAAATRSCTKFNLTAQMRSRFRQEGQGAVSARKEERRSRHQIGGGGLRVDARWTLGVWLATGRTFYYYSCDTLVSDF